MTRFLLAAAATACALPALAQATPPGHSLPGPFIYPAELHAADPAQYQADQHRYEMQRLRTQAEQREAFARQTHLEARLRVWDLEAA